MAYLRPNWLARNLINPLAVRLGFGGVKRLTVVGRTSGRKRSVPVLPLEYEGETYIVSARGETEWVRNLRASGTALLGRQEVVATEIPVEQSTLIVQAYRERFGKMPSAGEPRTVDSYFSSRLPTAKDHPVFRLE